MMSAISKPEKNGKTGMSAAMSEKMEMSSDKHHSHHASTLPKLQLVTALIGTFGVLALSMWSTNLFAPIIFTLGR